MCSAAQCVCVCVCAVTGGDGDEQKSNKKRVSWATDDNLTRIHYFEMDESERGDILHLQFNAPIPSNSE